MLAVPEIRLFADWFAGLGCETIADVRRLPRAGLQRRCGEHLLDSLDRAFGTAPELFDWLELPPTFSARIELPDRLEHADGALFAAHRLIVQLCGWLCAKQLAVSAITLSIEHERGRQALPPTLIEIALGEPDMARRASAASPEGAVASRGTRGAGYCVAARCIEGRVGRTGYGQPVSRAWWFARRSRTSDRIADRARWRRKRAASCADRGLPAGSREPLGARQPGGAEDRATRKPAAPNMDAGHAHASC